MKYINKYFSKEQAKLLKRYFESGHGVKNLSGLNIWLGAYHEKEDLSPSKENPDFFQKMKEKAFFPELEKWNKRRKNPFQKAPVSRLKIRIVADFGIQEYFSEKPESIQELYSISIKDVLDKLTLDPENIRSRNIGNVTVSMYAEFLKYLGAIE
jgi:hypothetical protein